MSSIKYKFSRKLAIELLSLKYDENILTQLSDSELFELGKIRFWA